MKYAIALVAGLILGVATGLAVVSRAHTPCGNDLYEPAPICRYVQVVNPYTGKLETEYVCD